MSGAAFEGLEGGAAPPSQGEDYQPGSLCYDPALADALFDAYLAAVECHPPDTGMWTDGCIQAAVIVALGQQAPPGSLTGTDANAFLDALVHRLAILDEQYATLFADWLLVPVLSRLYAEGHNSFALSLGGMPATPLFLAQGLESSADNPLEVTYSAACERLACGVKRCLLSFSGTAREIGTEAKDSSFTIHALGYLLGHLAEGCEFRIDPGPELLEKMILATLTDMHFITSGAISLEEVRGWFGSSLKNEVVLVPEDFYERGNTLYVPDGKGSWKEVRL